MDDMLRDDLDMDKARNVAKACNDLMVHAADTVPELFCMVCFLVSGFVYRNFDTMEEREGILQQLTDFARKVWVAEDQ